MELAEVFNSEMSTFSQAQENQGITGRRIEVRQTRNPKA
jgi:hypothetical protein